MNDLRKAAEMAVEALEHFNQGNSPAVVQGEFDDEIEALRHALHSTKFLPEEMDAYERGFIEGRQDQMRSTVERAVNAMAKREWVGLSDEEKNFLRGTWVGFRDIEKVIETIDELLRRRTYD